MGWESRTLYDTRKGVDFNQIYFPKEVGTIGDSRLKKMNKSLFRIVNSEFGWNDIDCGDYFRYTLKLDLVKADNKETTPNYPYLLNGSIPVLAFTANMGIDPRDLRYGPVESLHGREIYGFVSKNLKRRLNKRKYSEKVMGIIEAIALKPLG